jgi:type IV pilus assembly protein PilM
VIQDPSALLAILKKVKEKAGYDFVHVSLPEEKGYIVEMVFPASAGKDLYGAIELHLEEQVPLEASNITFDYEVVHYPKEIAGGSYIVQISATETSIASVYFDVCKEAGLLPVTFELESQAIARAVVPEGAETTMIVDVGREQSNVSVVCRNMVRTSTSISLGGNTLAKAIQDDLKIDAVEAVRLKEDEGLMRRGQAQSPFYSIVRIATILRDEIYQRLTYWNTGRDRSNVKDAVRKIVLCGGNASIPGLTEYLTSGANVPVSIGNPWINVLNFDEQIPEIHAREALKYCTAIGLALRSSKL